MNQNKTQTIGQYIEMFYNTSDEIKSAVNLYIKNDNPTVSIANAINLLSDEKQIELRDTVDKYFAGNIEPGKVTVGAEVSEKMKIRTYSDYIKENIGGKNVFISFLKLITASCPELTEINFEKTPEDYLLYFRWDDLDVSRVKSTIERYSSLYFLSQKIDYNEDNIDIFYGITNDMMFNYGMIIGAEKKILGQFKLTNSSAGYISSLNSKSISLLKKIFIDCDPDALKVYGKIKKALESFDIENSNKMKPYIEKGVLIFGFYGVGTWKNNQLDSNDLNDYKGKIKKWLGTLTKSSEYSVTANNHWLMVKVKNK